MKREAPTLDILTSNKTQANFFSSSRRNMSMDQTFSGARTTMNIKPRLIESKVSEKTDFYNLSDGFKRVFADDKKDKKLIIPVVGYGGHRRGDRS